MVVISSKAIIQKRETELVPNDIGYGCYNLVVVDDLLIVEVEFNTYYYDITNPKEPEKITIEYLIQYRSTAYTNFNDNILFALRVGDYYDNISLNKIDSVDNPTSYTKIADWKYKPDQLFLTNDTLYSRKAHGFYIYNATNLNNITILGNSTLDEYFHDSHFYIQDNYMYYISTYYNKLVVYNINSSYQLEFLKEYTFPEIAGLIFYDNYLYTCDKFGIQIFDYSNPSNLAYITHYNISSAQSIVIRNDIGYLTTSESFTILDLSNIMEPTILDQYFPGDKERVEMWKIILQDNLAVILTKDYMLSDYNLYYGGYLYIFDITLPNEIERLYPTKLASVNGWLLLKILFYIIPIVSVIIVAIIVVVIYKKNKKKQLNSKE